MCTLVKIVSVRVYNYFRARNVIYTLLPPTHLDVSTNKITGSKTREGVHTRYGCSLVANESCSRPNYQTTVCKCKIFS